MVQASLGMTPIYYEEVIDAVPQEQKIKKKIEKNGEWVDRIFIRIPARNVDKYYQSDNELEKWCYEHYKEPRYLGPWYKVSGYIILDEYTYTHWKLCE